VGLVQPEFPYPNTHTSDTVQRLSSIQYKNQYTGGTVSSFYRFRQITLNPLYNATFSSLYLRYVMPDFTRLAAFLGNS
jgi:hypothetical protein